MIVYVSKDDVTFLSLNKKVTKELSIGAALYVLLPQSNPPAPMYPTRPHRHECWSTLT